MADNLKDLNGVLLQGHIKISDPESGDIIVDKRNAIHYENMSISLAESIGNSGTGTVNIKSQSLIQNDLANASKTFNLFNSITETLNIGTGNATAINIGSSAAGAVTTFNKNVTVSGDLTVNGKKVDSIGADGEVVSVSYGVDS